MDWNQIVKKAASKAIELGDEYKQRLVIEFKEIEKQGANDYWIDLVVSDKSFDHNKNGLVMPFLIGLTSVDPIEQNIEHIWERQPDMPDIDVDFLPISRSEIKKYAYERFGQNYCCSVGNWITYKPKSAIQDACKSNSGDSRAAIELTVNLPDEFDDLDLKALMEMKERGGSEAERYQSFFDYYKENEYIIEMAYKMVGMIRAQGTHAGGLIIADRELNEIIPMSLQKQGGWTSQWTEGKETQLSKFGLIKFDVLGLKTMYYTWQCCRFIKQNRGIEIDWSDMDPDENRLGWLIDRGDKTPILMDDEESMKMINGLRTESVFQHETPIQKGIIDNGKVKNFWDMVAYSSLGRPGPMDMIPQYIRNRDDKNERWKDEEDEKVTEILKETYGIITFQEQLTAIWIELAGFTVPQAEESRKIISKKWLDKLPKVKERWISGASKRIGGDVAQKWWDMMESFGRYAFNKSHAVAYSIISFRCLYLKTHFGPEWWASVMSICHPDKLVRYMGVARIEGVTFAGLDATNLKPEFSVDGDNVSLGLQSLRGIGPTTAAKYCKPSDYSSMDDFIEKCGKSKTILERIIKLGAFDEIHKNRHGLWMWYQYKYGSGKDLKELKQEITSHFDWSEQDIQNERDRQTEEHKKLYPKRKKIPNKILNWKPKIGHTKTCNSPTRDQVVDLFDDYDLQENLAFEKEYLGYYWSSPLEMFKTRDNTTISSAKESCILEAVIEEIELKKSVNGNDYIVMHVTDGIESAKVSVWSSTYNSSDPEIFKEGSGVKMNVQWSDRYGNFSIRTGEVIPLERVA